MQTAFIKVDAHSIPISDLVVMLNSQKQILALTKRAEAIRHNKDLINDPQCMQRIFAEVKKIIS